MCAVINAILCGQLSQISLKDHIINVLILEMSRLSIFRHLKFVRNRNIPKNFFIIVHQGERQFGLFQQLLK